MITVWELDASKKEVRPVSFEQYEIGKTLSWIDCVQPTDREFSQLAEKTGIPIEELKDSVDPFKRPHVIPGESWSLIIFRAPYHDADRMLTTPVGVFLFKRDIITIHTQPIQALDEFRSLPDAQRLLIFRRGAPYFVYRFMDAAIGDFFTMLDMVGDELDTIEEQVLTEPTKLVTKKIFILKRALIYSHKALTANRDVITAIEKEYLREFQKQDLRVFRDLYNDTAQLIDLVTTYRDVLTSVLDMYLSSVSNNLNKIVKTLTIISAFVLVPTLIAGIYGMNFHFMPELSWKLGYPFALGVMVVSVSLLYTYFRKQGWVGWP